MAPTSACYFTALPFLEELAHYTDYILHDQATLKPGLPMPLTQYKCYVLYFVADSIVLTRILFSFSFVA